MGLEEEFKRSRDWVATSLQFNIVSIFSLNIIFNSNLILFKKDKTVSVFESTIRMIGGLLSAYELSRDKLFLTKAEELAIRFLPAFDTPSGIPFGSINLRT